MVSLVVPAYNEEEVIARFLDACVRDVKLAQPFEIVIVNDGSRDKTQEIVRGYASKYPFIRLVDHQVNRGLGKALETGFAAAKGDIVITMDSDLTHPPAMIKDLVAAMDGVDLCIASRYVRGGGMENVPAWRVFISRAANLFFDLILWTNIQDLSAGFKAYRASHIKKVTIQASGFECQMEIMLYFIKHHLKHREIPMILKNREFGTSKFQFVKMGSTYVSSLGRFLKYRWSHE
ncbi:MAG: glycosyltransferase family 2 protein [Candidatus Omnitrophica bacterium]|nr:glycosyltransferase family 2 protein [Candidatus Omnitrophota bacterium]